MTNTPNFKAVFDSRVERRGPDECWPWLRSVNTYGYGCITYPGGPQLQAHRVAYEFEHGPIPKGQQVLHSCDNPRCCNPRHLSLGSNLDNVADMLRKGRAPHAKLTLEQVKEIEMSKDKQRDIADRYGISQSLVSRIKAGARWGAPLREKLVERVDD